LELTLVNPFSFTIGKTISYAKFISYNETTGISEIEITEKESKISLNKEFGKIKFEILLYFQIFSIK